MGMACQGCGQMIDGAELLLGFAVTSTGPRWCMRCGGDPDWNGASRVNETVTDNVQNGVESWSNG